MTVPNLPYNIIVPRAVACPRCMASNTRLNKPLAGVGTMESEKEIRQTKIAIIKIAYQRGHIPEDVFLDPDTLKAWWEALDDAKEKEILEDCSEYVQAEVAKQRRDKRKILLLPVFGLGFAIMGAIPGALIGFITGLFGFHLIAGIVGGIFFFITYPPSRRRRGSQVDALTYFLALCGAVGGGLACYFIGSLQQ